MVTVFVSRQSRFLTDFHRAILRTWDARACSLGNSQSPAPGGQQVPAEPQSLKLLPAQDSAEMSHLSSKKNGERQFFWAW